MQQNYRLSYIILFTIYLLSFVSVHGQNTGEDFNTLVNDIISNKPESLSFLEDAFNEHKNDTLKMKFLVQKSLDADYKTGESFAYTRLGIFYRNKSKFNQAIVYHKKALDLALKAQNINLQVVNLNMLGVIYRRTDNVTEALNQHQKALTLAESVIEKNDDLEKSIAVSLNSMGNIYLTQDQPDLALDKFNQSLAIEKKFNNKLGLAINYQNIGYALEQKGELEMALSNYKASLNFNEEINSTIGKVICNNSIGQLYLKQNKPQKALDIIEPTLNKALAVGDQFYIASAYVSLGWAQLELGIMEEAEKNLKKGLQIAKRYNLKSSIADANYHLSELFKRQNDYKLAFEHYYIADTIYHNIKSEKNAKYISALTFQYENERKNDQIQSLANENELVKLKLKEARRNWIAVLLSVILIASIPMIINRQRQLKNEKKILTLEQEMLSNQMNPHFIFNSLNSIKLYIINNEKENAVYYLNKFSKLIRKILIASKEKEISLEEELETMELYMNIENIRFSNEIDYKVNVDDAIDLSSIKVPSLILQPFLENALWHGLSTKKDDKRITIDIKKDPKKFVTITITDNGIGRIEAEIIKQNKSLKRKSVGISLTNQRLSNFYKVFDNDYSIDIKDLYDENNQPSGTSVTLKIPINKHVLSGQN